MNFLNHAFLDKENTINLLHVQHFRNMFADDLAFKPQVERVNKYVQMLPATDRNAALCSI
jgi:hypothetical protein